VRFCHFPARIAKFNNVWWSFALPNFIKMDEFAFPLNIQKQSVSASGGGRSPCPPFAKYAADS